MEAKEKAGMLKIYVGESDKVNGKPLYEEIIYTARKIGIAGATVYKGVMSYGASHSMHTIKIFALSQDLPVSIEIVDTPEKLKSFSELLNKLMDKSKKGGMVTYQELDVLRYKVGEKYR